MGDPVALRQGYIGEERAIETEPPLNILILQPDRQSGSFWFCSMFYLVVGVLYIQTFYFTKCGLSYWSCTLYIAIGIANR